MIFKFIFLQLPQFFFCHLGIDLLEKEMKAIFSELLTVHRNFDSHVVLANRNLITHVWNNCPKQARVFKDGLSVLKVLIVDAES